MRVQRVAQRELNLAFGTGKGETFGVLGRSQKRDYGSVLSFTGGVALQRVAGGNHSYILQDRGGLRLGAAVGGSGKENVDAGTRTDETRDGDHFIHAHRYGAHAGWNQRRQTGSGILGSQLAGQNEFALGDGNDHTAAQDLRLLAVSASRQAIRGKLGDPCVMLFDPGSNLNVVGSDDCTVGSFVVAAFPCMFLYTRRLTKAPRANARTPIINKRVRFMVLRQNEQTRPAVIRRELP